MVWKKDKKNDEDMYSFNLMDEPWIEVQDGNHNIETVSLLDALYRAHELKKIYSPSPLMEYGLYRFIIAFVSDALEINSLENLIEILQKEKFSHPDIKSKIDDYIETWHDRFDLFDEKYPFYQLSVENIKKLNKPKKPKGTKETKKTEKPIKRKSVKELFPFLPVGTNKIFQYYTKSNIFKISPTVCARELCYLPPFISVGGGGYFPGINGSAPWYVLVKGKNLFELIVLNCLGYGNDQNTGKQPPMWCYDDDFSPIEEDKNISTVAGLTWYPRSVNVIPEHGGRCSYTNEESSTLIKKIIFARRPKYTGKWKDPHVCYITKKEKGENTIFLLRPKENRRMWRDIGSILLLMPDQLGESEKIKFEKPLVVQQFKLLQEKKIIDVNLPLKTLLYSLHTVPAQKKYLQMQKESLMLPSSITKKAWAGSVINNLLKDIDTGASTLKSALNSINNSNFPLDDMIYQYWVNLEQYFYDVFLGQLADQKEIPEENNQIIIDWKNQIKSVGSQSINNIYNNHKLKAENIQDQINVLNKFNGTLHNKFFRNNRR